MAARSVLSFDRAASDCPLGLSAVARELGVSVPKVRRLIHRGPLYAFRSGGRLLVRPARLAQFKADHLALIA